MKPLRDQAREAVRAHFCALMPEDLRALKNTSLSVLFYGMPDPGDEFPGYQSALRTLEQWSREYLAECWYDSQAGEVSEREPIGYEDPETGEWCDPDWADWIHFERRDVARVVFLQLVSDGGMNP